MEPATGILFTYELVDESAEETATRTTEDINAMVGDTAATTANKN